MPDKKVRGLKRKTKNMVNRIEQETLEFPSDFYNGYWHLHLPVAQDFISSSKTPIAIKRLCMQTLLDRAEHLIKIKPQSQPKFRIVVAIDLPGLWNSQIIVFSGDSHFKGFFERNDDYQKWIPLSKERNIMSEWNLIGSNDMDCLGIREEITDEDGELFESEIWFVGELK
ncbi:DUF3916 domain-containing protein [Sporosarcina sp. HYO08]|uniref:DUF3916 domain-containing protein n=1 Tax=Sporosarcina sp. HYO08 TaxID=1759557 RepID=UPI00079A458D|nr:DUF3916 domain-containing protein [Sporosarcina sp. HYO08]KXH86075.1 group-specific protein [Sporosarcina sp. HYO08]